VDWLEARSRGNPLFAIGLLRALLEEGGDLKAPRLWRLPEDLSQRVLLRYRRLGAEARTLIEVLAVNGAAMEFEDLQRLDAYGGDPPRQRLRQAGDRVESRAGPQCGRAWPSISLADPGRLAFLPGLVEVASDA